MPLISYTTFSVLAGAYLANRALYKYFFNPQRSILPISKILAQYKKNPNFKDKFTPKFLLRLQAPNFYEFRCNIDNKGQVDSPVSLKWDPIFSYLDQNKEISCYNYSAVYHPKQEKIDVLNFEELVEYNNNTENSKRIYLMIGKTNV